MKSTWKTPFWVDDAADNIRRCDYTKLNAGQRLSATPLFAEIPDRSRERNTDNAHEPDVGNEIREQHEADAQHHRHHQRMLLAIEKGGQADHAEDQRSKQSAWTGHSCVHDVRTKTVA